MLVLLGFNIIQGAAVATFVLVVVALPFVYGYTKSGKSNWGLLIPAYALIAVAFMLLFIEFNLLDGLAIPAYVNFAVALPFIYTYFQNRKKNWWALIPGGITAAVALSFLIASSAKFVGPALLIAVGAWLLIRQFTNKEYK